MKIAGSLRRFVKIFDVSLAIFDDYSNFGRRRIEVNGQFGALLTFFCISMSHSFAKYENCGKSAKVFDDSLMIFDN